MGFEAQEFIASGAVGIRVGAMLLPSTFTTETSLVGLLQRPFGTYAVTLFPVTSADNELDPRQEPCGTVPPLGGGVVPPLGGGVVPPLGGGVVPPLGGGVVPARHCTLTIRKLPGFDLSMVIS